MVELHYHSKTYQLPENFNELTGEQLTKINALLIAGLPKPMLRLMVLRWLLNISQYQFFKLDADCKNRMLFYDKMEYEFLNNHEETETSIDWVFTENSLTEQLLPTFKAGLFLPTFYGPKKEFDNLRVNEFHVCEIAYADYVKEESTELLNTVVAVLYRPCKGDYNHELDSDGDARVTFNPNQLEYWKKVVNDWPIEVRLSIFQFYDGCREYIKHLYSDIFSKPSEKMEEVEAGMYDIIRNLSGTKYGTFNEVENMLLHDVLKEIESSMKDAERQEQLLKQQGA
jgi:hypothetical protein